MAQFDVYRIASGDMLIDCQADVLSHLNTRLVIPLRPFNDTLRGPARFNPVFEIENQLCVLATEFAGTIPARELRKKVASLSSDYLKIEGAIDFLISGY